VNEIIKLSSGNIGGAGVQTVNLRELHAYLKSGTEFRHWLKRRLEEFDFVQDVDYVRSFLTVADKGTGRGEYHATIEMAKELAMVERNYQGKQARLYFIECERRLRAVPAPVDYLSDPHMLRAALLAFSEKTIELQQTIEKNAPAVEFAHTVRDIEAGIDMARMARLLKFGRNTFIACLRTDGILMENNLPYQKYMARGYFRVIEGTFTHKTSGKVEPTFSTRVTGKGQVYLQRKYANVTAEA